MKEVKGQALIDHLNKDHGFTIWQGGKKFINSKEYKRLQKSHNEEYHGRWQDQQDHKHE